MIKQFCFSVMVICLLLTQILTANAQSLDNLYVKQAYKEVLLTGFTRSVRHITVSSEVNGKVIGVNYEEGDVIKDQPFIEIDPTFINLSIKAWKNTINRTNVKIQSIKSRIDYLEKEYKRVNSLFKKSLVSEEMRDEIRQDLDQAKFDVSFTVNEKRSLEIELKELEERRKRYTINMPEGFVITQKNIEPGDIIEVGKELARVSDYRQLVVPLSVSREQLKALEEFGSGFHAMVEGKEVDASIKWLNPAFDDKTRKFKIELEIKNYEGYHRGGLQFTVSLKIPDQGIMIPKAAVIERYDHPKVELMNGDIVNLILLEESADFLIAAYDKRLEHGTRLKPVLTK